MEEKKLKYFEKIHASNAVNKLDNLDKSLEKEYRQWLLNRLENTMKRIDKQRIEYEEKQAQRLRDKDWYL